MSRSGSLARSFAQLKLRCLSLSKKNQATTQKTKRYRRDIDQIHEDLKDGGKQKFLEDLAKKDLEDLPGEASLSLSPCRWPI